MTRISVIVPTYNRPQNLAVCLASLARQTLPHGDFEVVVVDDGGDVDLQPIFVQFDSRLRLRVLAQNNTGPAGARNFGVGQCTGDHIAFTDDDCQPALDWLACLVSHLDENPLRMYGGRTINALESNLYSSASQTLVDFLYEHYESHPAKTRFFSTGNMAINRKCLDSMGGFDETFQRAGGKDRDLCDRWQHAGREMLYVPEAVVDHTHELTLTSFLNQHFQYGTGAWHYWQCRSQRGQPGFATESIGFYTEMLTYALRNDVPRAWSVSILIFVTQIANAVDFFRSATKSTQA